MDLAEIKAADRTDSGIEVVLRHPASGEVILDPTCAHESEQFVRVIGMESAKFREFTAERDRRDAMEAKKARGGKLEFTREQREARMIDSLVVCTIEMHVIENGKKIEQTPDEFRRIYTDYHWIKKQVLLEVYNDANFFRSA
jgi:hypothetical protein